MKNTSFMVHLVWLLVVIGAVFVGYKWGERPGTVGPTEDRGLLSKGEMVDFIVGIGTDRECEVRDIEGKREIKVERGDWVVWKNTTGLDQSIGFHNPEEVFGVDKIVIPAGKTLPLRVLDTAKIDTLQAQTFDSCDDGDGPPGIIVCPPGGC